jgi:hypothetical protein
MVDFKLSTSQRILNCRFSFGHTSSADGWLLIVCQVFEKSSIDDLLHQLLKIQGHAVS